MIFSRVEVMASVERRRRWPRAEKERLVALALEPGASASEIALGGGHVSQLFRWRQQLCERVTPPLPDFLPVTVEPSAEPASSLDAPLPRSRKAYRLLKTHDLIAGPAYVVIKAADQFQTKTTRPNEIWQTDFTYFKIIGWVWMHLSTVLDGFSRYIIAWKLCTNMRAEDVTETLDLALAASGCDSATVRHKPRLLSDNGPSYIAGELAEYIEVRKMSHVRGALCHPQIQGKIERWHQTRKNRILLENHFLPGDLEAQIKAFVEHYNQ